MIVDTSVVIAILFGEPGFEAFAEAIAVSAGCKISAASFLEASIIAESREGDRGVRQCDAFFRSANISIEPFTEEQAIIARQGFSDYGKGRHFAGLNFGDCFSYALTKVTGEPLLFKGSDFKKTDVASALSTD